jgi:type IV pilus assembly protein PilB
LALGATDRKGAPAAQEKKPLGQLLIDRNLITANQLNEALEHQKANGGVLGGILVELGMLKPEDLRMVLGAQFGMPVVNLDEMEISPAVMEKVAPSIADSYKIIPVSFEDGVLTVAMADPLNLSALDDLKFLLGFEVRGAVSDPDAIGRAYSKYYANMSESVETIVQELIDQNIGTEIVEAATETIDIDSLEEMADSAPVRKLLNLVLIQAIKDKASDIHFEPFEDEFKIRYRIDGVLYEMVPPPRHLAAAIVSRIKVMSNLDIAERRLPQDGRIELNVGNNPIDLRIAVLPTINGESVVMRVLDRSVVSLDLNNLGFSPDDLRTFRSQIARPNGIILCTGPTGCGKTTTLYAALNELNDVGVKIITTEDPVEYDIEGIMQVQIDPDIGVTFAECLRRILRQDPDIILVGEVRDLETARIAIQASLTGHLVFSTLHTNDAPSSITRLIDMGVEPFLLTATIEAIVAQRLVRVVCKNCKTEYNPSRLELMELNLTPDDVADRKFYYGKGCDQCNNTGFRGRTAIVENLNFDDTLRELVVQEVSTEALREVAVERGMHTLREAGLRAIFDGVTTIEEVVRETIVEAL